MNKNNKTSYISCIKINGVPILPPVVTPQLRKELIQYKHQAIKLEQRLENCRRLKKDLNELLSGTIDKLSPCSQITFGDNSHIEALDIADRCKVQKEINLTLDIIDVSQYDNTGIKIVDKEKNIKCKNDLSCDILKGDDKEEETNTTNNNNTLKQPVINQTKGIGVTTPPKPRLIRSNSYTLESPSPILLAHLQKVKDNTNRENYLTASKNWSSLEDNSSPCGSSDFGSINTVCYTDKQLHFDNKNSEVNPNECSKSINEVKSPTIEVYQTDISVQQITLNTCVSNQNESRKEERRELFFKKDPFDSFEPDSELIKILKDIPETAAKQIVELLKKQHGEQKERLERYDQLNVSAQKPSSVAEMFGSPNDSTKTDRSQRDERPQSQNSVVSISKELTELNSRSVSEKPPRSSTFSMSPSQSLYYSATSDSGTLTAPSTPSVKTIDLETDKPETIEIGVLREKNGYWEGVISHDSPKNCSKELFPDIDPITLSYLKKEWAASVIGAHVRGYLTRRLLRTEKVQDLITTVKEVLLCALELHHSDNIDEKDVELHRRLINQLSAALYSFHDIFFELSIPEKMLVIAADRQRQQEKMKKPVSRKTSARSLHSSRSNRSLSLSQNSSKSPSLTKV